MSFAGKVFVGFDNIDYFKYGMKMTISFFMSTSNDFPRQDLEGLFQILTKSCCTHEIYKFLSEIKCVLYYAF